MKEYVSRMVLGASLVTLVGCDSASGESNFVPCTPSNSDGLSYLLCKDRGGYYSCTAPKDIPEGEKRSDHCSCYCNEPSKDKEPVDKGW